MRKRFAEAMRNFIEVVGMMMSTTLIDDDGKERVLDADLDHGSKLDLDLTYLMVKKQKEQARQLIFNGGCKVSTRRAFSTSKNMNNNLSLGPGSSWLYMISLGEEAS